MLHLTISEEWYKFEEKLEIKKKKKFRLAFNQRKEWYSRLWNKYVLLSEIISKWEN